MTETLSEKLKSMGVHLGSANIPRVQNQLNNTKIEDVINGFHIHTPSGNVFSVQNDYPEDYVHGIIRLKNIFQCDLSRYSNKHILEKQTDTTNMVFLDIETSGLATGTGTFAFLIGIGYWENSVFRVVQIFLRDPSEEEAFLTALTRVIYPFTTMITYNGKSFDIPILSMRHILNGITSPFTLTHHIDLLHLARRIWKNRLLSRTMRDMEENILIVKRDSEEIPGWLIPKYYFDYLRSGNASLLPGVFYHNRVDILSLAALYTYISNLISQPENHTSECVDLFSIARIYDISGEIESAARLYEHCIKNGLSDIFLLQSKYYLAKIYWDWNNSERAIELWEEAAVAGNVDACIQLAKIFEHNKNDILTAIRWTSHAIDEINNNPSQKNLITEHKLVHRIARLEKKSSKLG